tara:strand:+ start:850 stop:993 length:144 start_codon:yes stop_codon:yes gene_type:complete
MITITIITIVLVAAFVLAATKMVLKHKGDVDFKVNLTKGEFNIKKKK